MLYPTPGKIWPIAAFDHDSNHRSHPNGDIRILGLMINSYMAGTPHRPTAEECIEWIKKPELLSQYQKAFLREFTDSWRFFDLWTFYFNSGCTLYEIAKTMRIVGTMAPYPVHYINSVARGYVESGEGPDYRERIAHFARWGTNARTCWRGFTGSGARKAPDYGVANKSNL